MPESDEWAKRRKKLFNEDIPENEDDKKLYYLNNVLLKTPADKNGIFLEIQKLSMTGVSEEVISAMESVFRRAVENSGRAIVEQLKNTESEGGEALVLQPTTEE